MAAWTHDDNILRPHAKRGGHTPALLPSHQPSAIKAKGSASERYKSGVHANQRQVIRLGAHKKSRTQQGKMAENKFDIIVYGATSFVGQIITRYMHEQFADGSIKWAIAGRSLSKLQQLSDTIGLAGIELIVADAADENALVQICARTKVVMSTVGPYALYGDLLVQVCATTGTHYCDSFFDGGLHRHAAFEQIFQSTRCRIPSFGRSISSASPRGAFNKQSIRVGVCPVNCR